MEHPRAPRYHLPPALTLRILFDAARGRRRSFAEDAPRLARGISALRVEGAPFAHPGGRGWLITVNHYCAPGFHAWYLPIVVGAACPLEARWVITSTLTAADPLRAHTITPLSEWLLPRLARAYGFFSMPPMPPRPWEAANRARSVRAVVRYARTAPCPVVGLAPEGGDSADGRLVPPPPGAGRFIALLAEAGLTLLPVGVFEEAGALCVRFGPPYPLPALPEAPGPRDAAAARIVVGAIAALLPRSLVSREIA